MLPLKTKLKPFFFLSQNEWADRAVNNPSNQNQLPKLCLYLPIPPQSHQSGQGSPVNGDSPWAWAPRNGWRQRHGWAFRQGSAQELLNWLHQRWGQAVWCSVGASCVFVITHSRARATAIYRPLLRKRKPKSVFISLRLLAWHLAMEDKLKLKKSHGALFLREICAGILFFPRVRLCSNYWFV